MPIGSAGNDVQRVSRLTHASSPGANRPARGGSEPPELQESAQVSLSARAQELAAQARMDPRQDQAASRAEQDGGSVRAQMLRAYDAGA